MHIAITIWAVIVSWRTWSWERFSKYHATILFFSAMNLLYLFFTVGYHLWEMEPDFGLSASLINMLYTFIVFPCTAMLFLSRYPNSVTGQVLHNLKWMIIYFVVEWIGGLRDSITYDNGWHLWWSLLFLIIMFPMLRLHYKKPLLAYLLTLITAVLFIYFFRVPWNIPVEERL